MKCIVGLGNPGSEYLQTRHNAGFRVIERLLQRSGSRLQPGNGDYHFSRFRVDDEELLVIVPTTYMNNSGIAVRDALEHFSCSASDLLIVFDDFQIPFGALRLRTHGSDGGHNGIGSIIYHCNTEMIARLRIGVGGRTLPEQHTHEDMAAYVLSVFTEEEEKLLPEVLDRAADASVHWAIHGAVKAMNMFNKRYTRDDEPSSHNS